MSIKCLFIHIVHVTISGGVSNVLNTHAPVCPRYLFITFFFILSFAPCGRLDPSLLSSAHIPSQLVRPLLWSSMARRSLLTFYSTCSRVGAAPRDPEHLEHSHLLFSAMAFSMRSPNVFLNQCRPEVK